MNNIIFFSANTCQTQILVGGYRTSEITSFSNGDINSNNSFVHFKRKDKLVIIDFKIVATTSSTNDQLTLCNIPSEYAPSKTLYSSVVGNKEDMPQTVEVYWATGTFVAMQIGTVWASNTQAQMWFGCYGANGRTGKGQLIYYTD